VLIKAETAHDHTADAGTVHICEFRSGKIFRSVHFPAKIDPNSAKAEYQNGMLRITAAIAKSTSAQKVEVEAA
jgi:HSP20 family molecular chaperone IbpA